MLASFNCALFIQTYILANTKLLRIHGLESNLTVQSSRHADGAQQTEFLLLFDHRLEPEWYEANVKELNLGFTPSIYFLSVFILHFLSV